MKHTNNILAIIFAMLFCIISTETALAETVNDTVSFKQQKRDGLLKSVRVLGNATAPSDSVDMLLQQFYMDQFRHFQDPEAPFFMLMSKDASLALGIGGQVKVTGWYDWNGSIDDVDFHPYEIPVPKSEDDKRSLGSSPSGTELFMTLLGNTKAGKFMAYIQGGFSGYHNIDFKLKKAYVTFRDWTVGYTKSTFSDPSAEIPVIDGGGQNGKIGHTTTLVRWTHSFRKHWSVAASVEMPDFGIQNIDSLVKKQNVYVPDIAAFVQYGWGESHLRLAGIVRVLPYRDLVTGKNHSKTGWGIQLSNVTQATRQLTLFATANVGQGISSYSNDLGVKSFDLISNLDKPGEMYAPTAWSLALGAQYYFTKNIFSAITLSEARYMPSKRTLPTDYKYGLYGAVNIFWNITPRLQIGAEYLIGKRQNFNREHACADRIDALFQFSF